MMTASLAATPIAALLGAGIAAIEAGRAAEADHACRAVLAVEPANSDAQLLLGLSRGLAGDARGAASLLHEVWRGQDGTGHPCHTLVRLLRRHGRATAVADHYSASLALAPREPGLLLALADHLHESGDPQGAIDLLAPLLARAPRHAAARLLTGIALADLGSFRRAIAEFRKLVKTAPQEAAAWSNLGMLLKVEGRFDEAIAAADRAVALAPNDARIRLNRAVALLRAGRLAEAWPDYEARLRLGGRQALPPERLLPPVASLREAGRGRTVLLTHEEGFGDTLQFLRYAPLLEALGLVVWVWAPRPLTRLLQGVNGVARVITAGDPVPATDHHCPMFSLPRVFETTLETIPAPLPYRPDPALARRWAARLGARLPGSLPRVGLAWAGQARPWLPGFSVLDGRRSLGLADLAPLARPGLRFVSLQMGEPAAQAAAPPPGLDLHDPMAEVRDFADTSAIIAELDAVVSVDTSVAHLAASMGKPVLLLDRYDSCWRWFANRADSPWYPSLRIFRQATPGCWGEVMARVAQALPGMIGAPRPLSPAPVSGWPVSG